MLLTPFCPAQSMPASAGGTVRHLTFVPAGVPLWQFTRQCHYIRWVVVDFDLPELAVHFGEAFEFTSRLTPRVMFHDNRLLALVELLADACIRTHPDDRLYGDSLALAISYYLFGLRRQEEKRGGLAPAKLRRVTVLMGAESTQSHPFKGLGRYDRAFRGLFCSCFQGFYRNVAASMVSCREDTRSTKSAASNKRHAGSSGTCQRICRSEPFYACLQNDHWLLTRAWRRSHPAQESDFAAA